MRICGILLALMSVLPGCGLGACDGGAGQVNSLSFTYQACSGVSFGCGVGPQRLAAGTTGHIVVKLASGGGAIARVGSSDPSVATFVGHPVVDDVLTIDVTALRPGLTDLQFIDLHGGVANEATVHVATAVRLDYQLGEVADDGTVAVMAGSDTTLDVTPLDESSLPLLGDLSLQISGESTVAQSLTDGSYAIALRGVDPATLTATLPGGVGLSATVRMDDVGQLLESNARAAAAVPVADTPGMATVDVKVRTFDAKGAVHGVRCSWTVDDPRVTFVAQPQPRLGAEAGEVTRFALPAGVDQATASCQIGALTSTVTLQR